MSEIEKKPKAGEKTSQEEEELYEKYMEDHPEAVIVREDLRECAPEIAEFEGMITSFELTYPLEALLLIVNLTPKEAPKHPIREPAKNALIPILEKLNTLGRETNISPEKYEELEAQYMRLSRAVGFVNNNKVDHKS